MASQWFVLIFNVILYVLTIIFLIWLVFTIFIEMYYNHSSPNLFKTLFLMGLSILILFVSSTITKRKMNIIFKN